MSMLISTTPPPAQRFFLADSSGSSSRKRFLSLQNHLRSPTVTPLSSSFTTFNPLRLSIKSNEMMMKVKRKESGRGFGAVCYSGSLTNPSIRWISTLSSAVLMLTKGTAVQKSFLVPLFALQAPPAVISWIKGEYGIWTAFLAILFRLFFFIPGELELPFYGVNLGNCGSLSSHEHRGKARGCHCWPGDCSLFGFPAFFTDREFAESI
ncbi:COLD-REGULATED 413 INNER MEMBRANE PROTEIN 1 CHLOROPLASTIC-RELATED [Salix purpurea]|uniref:COLD-REGULATED 413 INNER MEMBRANE PROTEIN 1 CHLOROPLASTIC-RELATED n=1 Tax=Salix purpurea TaxID=77065 RepID=A0A9Q0VSX8_SALPP|nr:COLD-REGULATED 413 INNER MEMBRANE PROTEIN 1 CHLOROPLASTIC-RELATED [Salix purpurea]